MRVKHTVAIALIGILLIQSAGLAQSWRDPAVRPIPRDEALQILLGHLQCGTEVRVQLAGTAEVAGQLAESREDEIVLLVSGQRRVIPVADVLRISRPLRRASSSAGSSFAVGAAIGTGLLFVVLFVARAAAR